jgi:mono/diheme cytochrome c family protein
VNFRLVSLPVYAKLTLSLFLALLGSGYMAALSLIFLGQGEGKAMPSYVQIRRHYVGQRPSELKAEQAEKAKAGGPAAAAAAPPKKLSELESKIIDGGSMNKYLGWLDGKEPKSDAKKKEAAELGQRNLAILTAWCDLARAEAAGKPNPGSKDAIKPAENSKKIDLTAALDDAKVLTFEQYHAKYAAVILEKHCVTCHGGGNPNGQEPPVFTSLAETRKVIDPKAKKGETAKADAEGGKTEPTSSSAAAPTAAEEEDDSPVGGYDARKLALHIHIHAVTMGFMALSVAVMMCFTGYRDTVKLAVIPWGLLGAIGDVGSWVWMKNTNWNVIHPDTIVQFVMLPSGGLFGLMLGVQIWMVFLSMWFGRQKAEG